MKNNVFPFSAIVGQDALRRALSLCAVNPAVGGVVVRGEKGTAKSTAVRALAKLLPRIPVYEDCPYGCNPDIPEERCPVCQARVQEAKVRFKRRPVVTLPLNATEDRVAGGLDFDLAVKNGVRVLQPGLLAKSHRGILYVDEVNLLDDHIVDLVLSAAGAGENRVEREGLSVCHASRFMLVGTMNPEEGELRPQFLDRFGLCVEIGSEQDVETRARIMRRREAFDLDKDAFHERFAKAEAQTADSIQAASALLPRVKMKDSLRDLIANLCAEKYVAGHRAELVIEQAARAHAALGGRTEVTEGDIEAVAPMALLHRTRDAAPPPPPPEPEEQEEQQQEPPEHDPPENEEEDQELPPEQEETQEQEDAGPPPPPEQEEAPPEEEMQPPEQEEERESSSMDKIFEVGQSFKVKRIQAPKDRVFRRGSGRRSRTRVAQKQGRYVKSRPRKHSDDIALDATLRNAAPFQAGRKAEGDSNLAVILKKEDLQERIREKRIGNFLLFVVDASGSMGAKGRMVASKGAIMSLLLDAYQKRDKVAMVSFRKDEALVNLPPTSSVELAAKLLAELPVGGKTPLAAGLVKCAEMVRNALVRDPSMRPIVLFITDGKANVGLNGGKPVPEAMELAERLSLDERVHYVVVDTESRGLVRFGLAGRLAENLGARYFQVEDLRAEQLVDITRNEDW
ncbi:protoporphyrin IX magnesium-chelatase [Desulfatibacillum alkenivorans DSM 16219]|jgi:magnesium chelatase subunit D|uniref:Mg-protoporphyrin IX chelatase n=1 Tax=Desulfatibacillum alkenivorans DSM 16219 TaxID=1121393 RepID=A0A1M6JVH4_9BACT|nr:putative cobaltochelatase [Desulfatibacillum alkenivorans]SHJ50735.1 protoporphyrin IX magnesium-chelatase [Desulfatibacillum alkenivorans DSM 16219]